MIKVKNTFIKNIYYMLSYAFKVLEQKDYENIALEDFDNIHNLFAAILSKGIGQQLKQGLYREYINLLEDLTVLRGKINMPSTIQNIIAHKRILSCEYDDLSANNIYNQILKTTVTLLLYHNGVNEEYKNELKQKMLFFSDIDTVDPTAIKWTSIRFQRHNHTYHMLIGICRLIIEGMLLTTEKGEHKLASFIDAKLISTLYEKFLLEYYYQHYYQRENHLGIKLKVNASQIPWAIDDDVKNMLPIMQSDITLVRDNKVLIIDAKYYAQSTQQQYGKHTIYSHNLYQIFTYVKNKSIELGFNNTVSGMILYARTDMPVQPDNTYFMSGNKISVKTLDLNCDFEEIKKQLNSIVQEHFV